MLNVKNIVVHYGGVVALRGVSLDVKRQDVTALIGTNGAGKSTCLRAISGLVPIHSGEIYFDGMRIDGQDVDKIVKLGIAHIPEGKELFPYMSVLDNLLTGAYLRNNKDAINDDLEKTFEYFPVLKKKRKALARRLSGGEQQMLAFGRALLSRPKVFLFDEPSLGIAPIIVKEIVKNIERLAMDGATIVLIEQNALLALSIAKKGYVLEAGRVVLEGDGRELQENPHVKKAYLGL